MSPCSVKALRTYRQGFVFYTALVANPSMGKTTGMEIIKAAVVEVEKYNQISENDSRLVNCKKINLFVYS